MLCRVSHSIRLSFAWPLGTITTFCRYESSDSAAESSTPPPPVATITKSAQHEARITQKIRFRALTGRRWTRRAPSPEEAKSNTTTSVISRADPRRHTYSDLSDVATKSQKTNQNPNNPTTKFETNRLKSWLSSIVALRRSVPADLPSVSQLKFA